MRTQRARPSSALPQLLAATLSVFAVVAIAAGANAQGSDDASAPRGLVVVIEDKPGAPNDLKAIENPNISAVALQIHWSDIEPAEGKFDWDHLDALFASANSSHKWVQLLIFPGFFAPEWAKQGAETQMFPLQYGPGHNTLEKLPMPWDMTYLNRWLDFLKQLSARFGSNPAFRVMAADGPTSVSAEFTLPDTPADVPKWLTTSYRPKKYLDAWQKVLHSYAADFPNQIISLSMGSGLPINDQGKRDQRERMGIRDQLINEAMPILGRRFALQFSNLDGVSGPEQGQRGTETLISYNGRIITGFQLRTNCLHNSGNMGAQGDPALALKRSLDKGMQPNSSGRRVNYIEIYQPDVLATELQPTLQYGASLFH